MIQSFNYALNYGKMNMTQRQGVIKVIPKKKKDRSYLENWRSLTLLNVDYKIATKTIAHRISKVLPKLIDEDQTGYVNGRYIGQSIRLIQDIMIMTEVEETPGMNNGYASEFFKLQRGVRQGCPLSGALFVLCAEVLVNAIRQDKTISGIKIFDREFKISQYADDTTVFVSDLESAENLFKLLNAFQKCSGLEINKSKTEGMWLGANRNKTSKHFDIAWPFSLNQSALLELISHITTTFLTKKISNKSLLLWKPFLIYGSLENSHYMLVIQF